MIALAFFHLQGRNLVVVREEGGVTEGKRMERDCREDKDQRKCRLKPR